MGRSKADDKSPEAYRAKRAHYAIPDRTARLDARADRGTQSFSREFENSHRTISAQVARFFSELEWEKTNRQSSAEN
jgi:hypothetical protein